VIWDLSEQGARLAAARLGMLPDLFTLNFTRDGKSRRVCQRVWRKKPHMGVRFVEQANVELEEAPLPRRAGAGRLSCCC
jgi:hypothetical protein